MTPEEETATLWAEVARQREQNAALVTRAHELEARLVKMRWALMLCALVVLLAAVAGLLVAWGRGAFESRVKYWSERGQNCGSVVYAPNGALKDRSGAEQAVACFAAAQARCRAATLTKDVSGTDTEELYTFVVEPRDSGDGCDVGLRFSGGIVGRHIDTTRETQCARVVSADGVLSISGCQGFGDITMP